MRLFRAAFFSELPHPQYLLHRPKLSMVEGRRPRVVSSHLLPNPGLLTPSTLIMNWSHRVRIKVFHGHRSPQHYLAMFTAQGYSNHGFKIVYQRDNETVAIYNSFPGVCAIRGLTVGSLYSAIIQLNSLHRQGFIHGDIRLANLIVANTTTSTWDQSLQQAQNESFKTTAAKSKENVGNEKDPLFQALWIDFDFSQKSQSSTATYPETYNRELYDTERHPGAHPKALMQVQHDVYSLCWIICQLQLADTVFDKHRQFWGSFQAAAERKKLKAVSSTSCFLSSLTSAISKSPKEIWELELHFRKDCYHSQSTLTGSSEPQQADILELATSS